MLLTTAVLAILTAYSGAVGDAALRHAPAGPRNAADTALIVKADVPEEGRRKADAAVREGARETFGGLPVTVRTLTRSGPYALPATPRPRGEDAEGGKDGEDGDDPDLTYFAALDPAQVRVAEGRPPATSGERNDGQHTGRNAGRPPAHDGPDPLPGPAPAGPGVAPQAVLAAAGGALTGWATVRLLAPGVDLTAIALATASSPVGRTGLRTDPWSLALPAVAVLVVAVGVAGVQAWWSGRRGSVTELRAGDAR